MSNVGILNILLCRGNSGLLLVAIRMSMVARKHEMKQVRDFNIFLLLLLVFFNQSRVCSNPHFFYILLIDRISYAQSNYR